MKGVFPAHAVASFLERSSTALCDPFESNIKNIYCVYFPYKMHFYHSIVHSSLFLQTNSKLLRTLVMLLGSCWVYPQALPLIHISFFCAACHSASEQGKLSAKGPVWGQAHCECPANHAGLAELEHGWTVRFAPSMLTGGKHWRKIGSVCLPGDKSMKCLILLLWRDTSYF